MASSTRSCFRAGFAASCTVHCLSARAPHIALICANNFWGPQSHTRSTNTCVTASEICEIRFRPFFRYAVCVYINYTHNERSTHRRFVSGVVTTPRDVNRPRRAVVKKKTGGAYLYAHGNNLTTLLSVYTVYTQSVLRIPPPAPRPDDGRAGAALHGECDASCLFRSV